MALMPTLCGNAGPLPESYRPFLNAAGDLQIGDAFGLEAQWIINMVDIGPSFAEQDWTMEQIREDSVGIGCARCGDEAAPTVYGLCRECR